MKQLSKVFALAAIVHTAYAQSFSPQVSPEILLDDLQTHVRYLASDELEGRGSGTPGNTKAAQYLESQFRSYGLLPAGSAGTYFQEFEFVSAVSAGKKNACILRTGKTSRQLVPDKDFRPMGFSTNTTVEASLVFAGYGISAPDDDYDDYAAIDVTGKAVVVLRFGPDGNDIHSKFYKHTSMRNKARIAREKGAVALIVVDGSDDRLMKLSYDQSFSTSGIASVVLHRDILEGLLKPMRLSIDTIQDSIKSSRKSVTFNLPEIRVDLTTDIEKITARTANVLGYFPGNDPQVKDEVIVVGAHFDHLGYGGEGSGSLQPDQHAIHNGADDNASGTAALLELAHRMSLDRSTLKRTVLFIGFSAEELGTIGSAYYVNNPFFPIDKTITMINMDMVGRMKDNTLTVQGVGTSPLWDEFVRKLNTGADTVHLKTVNDGFGPSDHAQFYGKNIPVLFFFTGTHNDYHKPSDDWDKINYEDHLRITTFVHRVAMNLQARDLRPEFARAQSTVRMGGDSRGFSVTLGVVPDYAEGDIGMKIGGTRPDGPAEKAGLKSGDIITGFAGKKVLNIYDYMGILGELKDGQVVEVTVMRDGKPLTFSVTMQRR